MPKKRAIQCFDKKITALLTAILLCTALYAKDGYKISVKAEDYRNGNVLLTRLSWDGEMKIDSATLSRNGRARLSGKTDLEEGEYSLRAGDAVFEIFISGKGFYNASFDIRGLAVTVRKANAETVAFIDFQNRLQNEWHKLPSQSALLEKIDSSYYSARENLSGSLLESFLKASSSEGSVITLAQEGRIAGCKFGKSQITSYLDNIEYNSADIVRSMVDTLLANSSPEMAPKIAIEIFNKFAESKVMGHEAIAVHIADDYFLNGRLKAPDSNVYFAMQSFAHINRNSLPGMRAPELTMQDTLGNMLSLSELVAQSEYTLLYFYSDNCINCKKFTPKLVEYLNNYNGNNLSLYAVYTEESRERWLAAIKGEFQIKNDRIKTEHVYDPMVESSYHLLYGVISTPKLYMIDHAGTIIGRELTVDLIGKIAEGAEQEKREMFDFFRDYFERCVSSEDVRKSVELMYEKTCSDERLNREIMYGLFDFLSGSENETYREAAQYLRNKYLERYKQ